MDLFDDFYDYVNQNKHHLSNNIFHKKTSNCIELKNNIIFINYYPEISDGVRVNQ